MDGAAKIAQEKERSFYVCPVCRITFALRKEEEYGVSCPGCHHHLSIDEKQNSQRPGASSTFDAENNWETENAHEVEREVLKDGGVGKLVAWCFLSCCLLGMSYVTAVIMLKDKPQVVENKVDSTVDYLALSRLHVEKFIACDTADAFWLLVDQGNCTKQLISEYLSHSPLNDEGARIICFWFLLLLG